MIVASLKNGCAGFMLVVAIDCMYFVLQSALAWNVTCNVVNGGLGSHVN
jgi:hypothetical protein